MNLCAVTWSVLGISCRSEQPNVDEHLVVEEWQEPQVTNLTTFGVVPQDNPSLTRAHIHSEEILFEPMALRGSVCRAVATGLYPAGGSTRDTFQSAGLEIKDKLCVAWETEKYASHALAVSPRSAQDDIRKIQDALVTFDGPKKNKNILHSLRFNGRGRAADEDRNDVRTLEQDTWTREANT